MNNSIYVKVKVKTSAKKESVKKISDDKFEISIREPAEKGLANERILELVREHFKVYNVKEVRLVSGHHSPHKIISISYNN